MREGGTLDTLPEKRMLADKKRPRDIENEIPKVRAIRRRNADAKSQIV
tara:strand:+ start:239 stop:382 length:144 start_codon:yes stop_codon:yes gene_type:complete